MLAALVIIHGLLAILLLGAVTHQGLSVWRRPAPARHFVDRFRAVHADIYVASVVLLYLITFAMGAYIYPNFVLDVKTAIAEYGMQHTIFLFQMKEHVAVIGLGLLPAYWQSWGEGAAGSSRATRRIVTTVLMLCTWWALVIGHILDNVRGLM